MRARLDSLAHHAPRPDPVFVAQHTFDRAASSRCTSSTHPYAVLSFYTGGRARIEQRGRWTVEAGDVLLTPAGDPHHLVDAQTAQLWGLALCVPCWSPEDAATLLEPFERVRDGAAAVVRVPTARHDFLGALFRELAEAARPERSSTPAVQRSLLTLIMAEVLRAADTQASLDAAGARTAPPGVVAESLRFIERRCLGPLTVADVAAAVGRTPSYVTTALTRATGHSAGAWITAGRMAEARRRLLHSDARVEDVAEQVGYADATHFIRTFRRQHGATPAAWRSQQRPARAP